MLCAVKSSNLAGIDALIKKGIPVVWPEKYHSFLDIYLSKTNITHVPDVVSVSIPKNVLKSRDI